MVTGYRVIYRLQQKGLLKITRQTHSNGGQKQNLYTLLFSPESKEALPKKVTQMDFAVPELPQNKNVAAY